MKKTKLGILILFFVFANTISLYSISYQELYSSMMMNNKELLNANIDYRKSRLDTKDARGKFGPKIENTTSYTYLSEPPMKDISISKAEIASIFMPPGAPLPDGNVTIFEGMSKSNFSTSFSITQPVFTWGKIKTSLDIYKELELLGLNNIQDLEKRLCMELKTLIAGIYFSKEIIKETENQLSLANKLVKLTENIAQSGLILPLELNELEIKQKELDIFSKEIKINTESLLMNLKNLTGIKALDLESINELPPDADILLNSEPNFSLRNNSTLKMLENLKRIDELKTRISKSSIYYKPDFALSVSAGYSGSHLPFEKGFKENNSFNFSITFALKTTLWDGGKLINDIKRSLYNEKKTEIKYNQSLDELTKQLEQNELELELSNIKIEWYKNKTHLLNEKLRMLENQFNIGTLDESELIKVMMDIGQNRIEYLKEEIKYHQKIYFLQYLIN